MDQKLALIADEEQQTHDQRFWDDPKAAELHLRKIKHKKFWTDSFSKILSMVEDLEILYEFKQSGDVTDEELASQYQLAIEALEKLEFKNMLSNEEDQFDAIIEINAGAGGTESNDWANMLMRMYAMWAEKNNIKIDLVDEVQGEVAGIKSVIMQFTGEFAFGYLKGENGVHRLVRISPFDSSARRHTSFASVYVYPLVDDDIEIEVNPAEISWETYRSSGKGGQNVNKVETAVRLRHAPSGLVVECQKERSQLANKERALKMLKSQLYELEVRKRNEEQAEVEAGKMKIEWGSQIRNYVMHPYKLVKDLRTNEETSNVQAVMDGDLEKFIKAFLMSKGNS
ncbi:MAG: peptide chain release factor 2 [Bacteroidetes bacterium MED-G17]|nr:MAG: peptide chain release factor 2 [Bacteroidetes bacterium MED-G17]